MGLCPPLILWWLFILSVSGAQPFPWNLVWTTVEVRKSFETHNCGATFELLLQRSPARQVAGSQGERFQQTLKPFVLFAEREGEGVERVSVAAEK